MALDVEILGSAELKKLAAQIKAAGNKGLGTELGKAMREAAKPVERAIRAEYKGLPASGGYAGVFSKSLRFRTSLRTSSREGSLRLLTFADGTHQRRDINKLEAGQLRHPVFGRSRGGRKGERISNPWAVTTVRGNFHKRGTDHAADEAEKQMDHVVTEFAERLIG